MIKALFLEWVNKRMKAQNRKVLMILDNCTAHPHVELGNMELLFLPKNTMSHLQPLDAGIIQAVKLLYRKSLLRRVAYAIGECGSVSELSKDVDLFEAIVWLKSAWDLLKESTIRKCFAHCGISSNESSADGENDAEANGDVAPEMEALLDGMTLSEFADMDHDLYTSHEDDHDDWEQRIVQDLTEVRQKYFTAESMELFRNVPPDKFLGFLREVSLFHKI
nr:hypothetical protein BaRGS_024215 [Batillaria attramentaria]